MGYHRSRWNQKFLPANMRDIYMIRVGDNFKVMDYGFNYDDGNKTLKGHKSKIIASDYTQMKTGFGHQYIQSNHIWGPKEYDNWSWDRGRAERWEDPRYRMQLPTTITEKDEGGEVYSNFAFDDGSVKTYNNIFWEHWRDQMTWTLKNEGQFLPNDSATD